MRLADKKVVLQTAGKIKTVKYPVNAEIKYDGVRIIIIWDNLHKEVTFKTRNNKEVHLPALAIKLTAVFDEIGMSRVFDTECTLASGKQKDRTTVSGLILSAMHGNAIDESLLVFHVFDTILAAFFFEQKKTHVYSTRRGILHDMLLIMNAGKISTQLRLAEQATINSHEELQEHYKRTLNAGYEGLILKYDEASYEYKRSSTWAKMKASYSVELTCERVELGAGKYAGLVGALVCVGIVEDKEVQVKVGTGLTDADRKKPAAHYAGAVIEVKYNCVTLNTATDKHSLFLPVFKSVRFDK